jgi:signal transduction histidine kinase
MPPALAIAALRNLLDNARRHTRDGTVVRLTLEQRCESKVRFIVQDQGPGIASELVERFTERFWRSSQGDGSGLAFFIEVAVLVFEPESPRLLWRPFRLSQAAMA